MIELFLTCSNFFFHETFKQAESDLLRGNSRHRLNTETEYALAIKCTLHMLEEMLFYYFC